MRAWQIFAVGTAGLFVACLLPVFGSLLPCGIALGLVAIVLLGFLLRPRNEVFILKTTVRFYDLSGLPCVQHNQIAVKVELVRLWLLFGPTSAAVAFLVAWSGPVSAWSVKVVDYLPSNAFLLMLIFRLGVILCVAVMAIISAWITERWVLRDANACSARTLACKGAHVSYAFMDPDGEFYGGDAIVLAGRQSLELATIVLYRAGKPEVNKISMGCLFHKLVIAGQGITDLDQDTVKARFRLFRVVKGWAGQGSA
jgi:hypothetical protein